MKRMLKGQGGMSLVEATIILMVLAILTAVLSPSIVDFVIDAKVVKVKEDCEAIGVSIMRMTRDIGPCVKYNGQQDCTGENRVPALFSRGPAPFHAEEMGWNVPGDSMENQLVKNRPHYPLNEWRGAYISAPIGPDPWGSRYAVNTWYLGEILGRPEQQENDRCFLCPEDYDRDVICISAGPNRRYETHFRGNDQGGTTVGGDDFVFVIGGSQRARAF